MWNNKLIIAVVVGVAVVGLIMLNKSEGMASKEHFWNIPARTWKVEKMYSDPSSYSSSQSGNAKGDYFQSPHFQSLLSPRFSNVNYGPNLRTQFPAYSQMGVPKNPLGYPSKKPSVQGGGVPLNVFSSMENNNNSYANGNFDKTVNDVRKASGGPIATDTVATGIGSTLGPDGEIQQPIVYDRYIYANRKSRLRSGGDPIRGDLPIVPDSGNWFTPSVHPNIDLQPGAINVLAGVNNDTSKQLANIIYNASGRANTTIGGVDMAGFNLAQQNLFSTNNAGGDIAVRSFP